MSAGLPEWVHGRDNLRGILEPPGAGGPGERSIRLEDGRRLAIPAGLLVARAGGGYDLPLGIADLVARDDDRGETVVPVVEENAEFGTRRVETGRVRVTKSVAERQEVADVPLARETVEVERVAVNRVVPATEGPRQEGDTLVIPLYEELLVIEKRIVLKEEIRVTTRRSVAHEPQTVTLKREEAVVERVGPGR